jgi:hypothetical protein
MDSVHVSWTSAGRGPWWTDHHGRPWSSLELGIAAAPGHGGLPRGGEKKEGAAGSLIWVILRLGRQRGGGVGVVEPQLGRAAAWAQ